MGLCLKLGYFARRCIRKWSGILVNKIVGMGIFCQKHGAKNIRRFFVKKM